MPSVHRSTLKVMLIVLLGLDSIVYQEYAMLGSQLAPKNYTYPGVMAGGDAGQLIGEVDELEQGVHTP